MMIPFDPINPVEIATNLPAACTCGCVCSCFCTPKAGDLTTSKTTNSSGIGPTEKAGSKKG